MELLECIHLSKEFDNKKVLNDIKKENIVAGLMSSGDFNGLTKEDLVTIYD